MKVLVGRVMSRLLGWPVLVVAVVFGAVYLWTVSYPAFERDIAPRVEVEEETAKKPVVEKAVERTKGPAVRLGVIPKLKLLRSTTVSAAEADGIRRLIGRLATAEKWESLPRDTIESYLFSTLSVLPPFDPSVNAIERLDSSMVIARLVKLGPKALPFLLDALGDKTLTRVMTPAFPTQGSSVLWGNPVNASELEMVGPWFPSVASRVGLVDTYTATVGDLYFELIGTIVGRPYHFADPLGGRGFVSLELRSVTSDAKLRDQVRRLWSSKDAGQRLFESLLIDYATRPVFDAASCEGGRMGTSLQANAAARLLLYFPKESAELIAGRLDMLDVDSGANTNHDQLVMNGVIAADFIKAVAWCDEPRVKAALERVVERTTDAEIIRAAHGPIRNSTLKP